MGFGSMKDKASIIGVGCTKFGSILETPELKDLTFHEMAAMAAKEAMDDAGVTAADVDGFIIGNMLSHSTHLYSHNTQMCDWLGLELKPSITLETACSTTNSALGTAAMMVASGKMDCVLAMAGEILSSEALDNQFNRKPLGVADLWYYTDFGVDQLYAYHHSYDVATAYGAFPIISYMKKYKIPFEKMDEAMRELHRTLRLHGSMNPKAFVTQTLEDEAKGAGMSVEEFWKSKKNPLLSWPCRVKSLLNTVDGASAMIVCNAKVAEKLSKKAAIDVSGFHWSTASYPWFNEDMTEYPIDREAFKHAYKMAGIDGSKLDYMSCHDCMQIHDITVAENAGYVPKGTAWKAAIEGKFRYDGEKPMHTDGGRHAKGHAFTASAGSDIFEAVKQLRGEAGKRQIKKPVKWAAVHNHGYGLHTAVSVLHRRGA